MLVVGPEVMSKSRSNGNGSVTVAKGRVTADFSEIEEADYRIELDGKSATMSDLKRIEPGKIRNRGKRKNPARRASTMITKIL